MTKPTFVGEISKPAIALLPETGISLKLNDKFESMPDLVDPSNSP
jgi:hypothetical protein